DTVRHLLRVACGLESMMLGEAEILGQVRRAYEAATAAGAVDTVLHRACQTALRVGKRVRTETALGRRRPSVGSAAVRLARSYVPNLADCTAMVIGAGENAELVLKHLHEAGV